MIRTNKDSGEVEFIPGPPVYSFKNYGEFLAWLIELHKTVCFELALPHNLQAVLSEPSNEDHSG